MGYLLDFGPVSYTHLVVGTLSMTSKGFGFVIPDVKNSEEETDVFIPVSALNSATVSYTHLITRYAFKLC